MSIEELPYQFLLGDQENFFIRNISNEQNGIIAVCWIDFEVKGAIIYYDEYSSPKELDLNIVGYQFFLDSIGIERIELVKTSLGDVQDKSFDVVSFKAIDEFESMQKKITKANRMKT